MRLSIRHVSGQGQCCTWMVCCWGCQASMAVMALNSSFDRSTTGSESHNWWPICARCTGCGLIQNGTKGSFSPAIWRASEHRSSCREVGLVLRLVLHLHGLLRG